MGDLRQAAAGAGAKFFFPHGAASLSDQKEGNHQAEYRVRLPEAVKVIESQTDEQGHRQQAAS